MCAAAATLLLWVGVAAAAQDSLAAARNLYAAAAYEDALARLNELRGAAHAADEGRAIEQYRAFCLLALGRNDEAEQAIEAVVTAAPFYRPADADVSPRVRSAFRDVRQRLLPGIIQRTYTRSRGAYDRKEYASAADGFKQVLDLLGDPDISAIAAQPPLSEVRTLAANFRELSAAAAAPPRPSPPVPVRRTAPPVVAARTAPPRIYAIEDPNVMPPEIVRQSFTALADVFALRPGVVEIIIDELGDVESAVMTAPVNPVYDRLALSLAKGWRYRPALLDGRPVKFRKVVLLDVKKAR
jgi:tetratricopeptide (TPR) repeat protein